jgi:hypothetical protein
VFFVLEGGGGILAEIFTIRNNKNRKKIKLGRDEKLTCVLAVLYLLASKIVWR